MHFSQGLQLPQNIQTDRHADSYGHALESAKIGELGHLTDPSLSEAKTWTTDADSLVGRIEDADGNKARAKIRHKIREEKGILTLALEKYNRLVPHTEILCLEEILSGDTACPWQQPHSGTSTYTNTFSTVIVFGR
ncbi:hypothetical protein CHARACLAT_028333 [Characodon lateralis]|uniref:Uncharacterized protein n=1 Tax=Characodon lateralis TaxID=208331 RepID=A0ABU7CSP2_9TELE|nr:hypothetical protein [Characodon lateralis]